jgi:AcrR family transcriptional regulator
MRTESPSERTARRDELREIGLRLFSTHAFDELSMDDVAAEAGVAKGLLYYYFGSKRGLYVAVVRAAATELRAQWDADPAVPAERRLADGLDAYLAYAQERPEGYRALMAGGVGTDPEVRAVLNAEREQVIRRVVEALDRREPGPALRTALQGWLSFLEGATLEWLDRGGLERDELRALLLVALDGALRAAHSVDPSVPAAI